MKVCSKCNAHYEDDIFFCLQDGTPLENTDKVRVSNDNPNFTGEETHAFDSEQTHIKSGEIADDNKSEVTIARPNTQDSEATVIRSNANDSEATFVRPVEAKSEATVVRPKPIAVEIPNAKQVDQVKIQQTPDFEFTATDSDSSHTLKIAAIASGTLILIISICVISGAFSTTPDPIQGIIDTNVDYPDLMDDNDLTATVENTPDLDLIDDDSVNETENPQESNLAEPNLDDLPVFETIETPAATPKPVTNGKISGKLTYPSEGIPSNFHICVREIKKNVTACSNNKKANFQFNVNRSAVNYSVNLPDGSYYIYATVPGQGKAYYTQYVRCGMDVKCKSHKKIPIKVRGGKTVGGIMVGDWYDF